MSLIAASTFVGVIKKAEKTFKKGDTITAAEAKEMNLAAKPELTTTKEDDNADQA